MTGQTQAEIRRRNETVLSALATGHTPAEVATITGLSERQVRRIRQRARLYQANHPEETPRRHHNLARKPSH